VDYQKQIPIIYNLFPRITGTLPSWIEHAERAAEMGFNWLYINSILYPGFSGSLYAVKYHYRINPEFLPSGKDREGLELLEQTLQKIRDLGLWPMMDLVINHTSIDCPLIQEHPQWYVYDEHGKIVSPYARDPDDPEKITVWGDLAEINNAGSSDRDSLWKFWAELVKRYIRLGFKGFRCDAAYKVPGELWHHLVEEAIKIDPEVIFFAETLGCTVDEALALRDARMHYFFNSSKWWDFEQPWCLEQHDKFGKIAPSISFPESHDTTRLAADTEGNEAVQRQRYAFAAVFSAGIMMPIGYEFGFRKNLDVVATRPTDWETPAFDLRKFIKRVNRFKMEHHLFQGEGNLRIIRNEADVLALERRSEQAPGQRGWILINKNWDRPVSVNLDVESGISSQSCTYHICLDEITTVTPLPSNRIIALEKAEVAILKD